VFVLKSQHAGNGQPYSLDTGADRIKSPFDALKCIVSKSNIWYIVLHLNYNKKQWQMVRHPSLEVWPRVYTGVVLLTS